MVAKNIVDLISIFYRRILFNSIFYPFFQLGLRCSKKTEDYIIINSLLILCT